MFSMYCNIYCNDYKFHRSKKKLILLHTKLHKKNWYHYICLSESFSFSFKFQKELKSSKKKRKPSEQKIQLYWSEVTSFEETYGGSTSFLRYKILGLSEVFFSIIWYLSYFLKKNSDHTNFYQDERITRIYKLLDPAITMDVLIS